MRASLCYYRGRTRPVFACSHPVLHHFVTLGAVRPFAGRVGYAARQEVPMRLESVGKRYGLRQPWVVRSVSLDVLPGRLRAG